MKLIKRLLIGLATVVTLLACEKNTVSPYDHVWDYNTRLEVHNCDTIESPTTAQAGIIDGKVAYLLDNGRCYMSSKCTKATKDTVIYNKSKDLLNNLDIKYIYINK